MTQPAEPAEPDDRLPALYCTHNRFVYPSVYPVMCWFSPPLLFLIWISFIAFAFSFQHLQFAFQMMTHAFYQKQLIFTVSDYISFLVTHVIRIKAFVTEGYVCSLLAYVGLYTISVLSHRYGIWYLPKEFKHDWQNMVKCLTFNISKFGKVKQNNCKKRQYLHSESHGRRGGTNS